jgi:hypothetical protein
MVRSANPRIEGMNTATARFVNARSASPSKCRRRFAVFATVILGPVGALPASPASAGGEVSTPTTSATPAAPSPPPPAATLPLPPSESPPRIFLTLAPGLSNLQLAGAANLTVEIANIQVSARWLWADGVDLDVSPTESIEERALLLARTWRRGSRTLYLGAGLARVSTEKRGAFLYREDSPLQTAIYESLRANTWGFPFEAGVAWDRRFGGIGFALIGDLNSQLPLGALVLTLRQFHPRKLGHSLVVDDRFEAFPPPPAGAEHS